MSITDTKSVSFGLLAMYVEDMYDAAVGSLIRRRSRELPHQVGRLSAL